VLLPQFVAFVTAHDSGTHGSLLLNRIKHMARCLTTGTADTVQIAQTRSIIRLVLCAGGSAVLQEVLFEVRSHRTKNAPANRAPIEFARCTGSQCFVK
jgi:hypothetical protein